MHWLFVQNEGDVRWALGKEDCRTLVIQGTPENLHILVCWRVVGEWLRANNGACRTIHVTDALLGVEGTRLFMSGGGMALEVLRLSRNAMTCAGCAHLATAVSNTISVLELSSNNIRDEGAKALGAMLLTNTSLRELDLSRNEIGPKGAIELAVGLRGNPSLQTLVLSYNRVGDRGIAVLGAALKGHTTLVKLLAASNRIGSGGCAALGASLRCSALEHLNLSHNRIGDHGAERLAKAIGQQQLRVLYLSDNAIGDTGAAALAGATTLTDLALHGNRIGCEGAKRLGHALLTNRSMLRFLALHDNRPLGVEGGVALARGLGANGCLRRLELFSRNDSLDHESVLTEFRDALKNNWSLQHPLLYRRFLQQKQASSETRTRCIQAIDFLVKVKNNHGLSTLFRDTDAPCSLWPWVISSVVNKSNGPNICHILLQNRPDILRR